MFMCLTCMLFKMSYCNRRKRGNSKPNDRTISHNYHHHRHTPHYNVPPPPLPPYYSVSPTPYPLVSPPHHFPHPFYPLPQSPYSPHIVSPLHQARTYNNCYSPSCHHGNHYHSNMCCHKQKRKRVQKTCRYHHDEQSVESSSSRSEEEAEEEEGEGQGVVSEVGVVEEEEETEDVVEYKEPVMSGSTNSAKTVFEDLEDSNRSKRASALNAAKKISILLEPIRDPQAFYQNKMKVELQEVTDGRGKEEEVGDIVMEVRKEDATETPGYFSDLKRNLPLECEPIADPATDKCVGHNLDQISEQISRSSSDPSINSLEINPSSDPNLSDSSDPICSQPVASGTLSGKSSSAMPNTQPICTQHYYLHSWCLKIIKNALIVEGIKDDEDMKWHSGRIVDVCPPDQLLTKSGSVYHLVGPPDESMKKCLELSEEAFVLFQAGLPYNWKSLIQTDSRLSPFKGSGNEVNSSSKGSNNKAKSSNNEYSNTYSSESTALTQGIVAPLEVSGEGLKEEEPRAEMALENTNTDSDPTDEKVCTPAKKRVKKKILTSANSSFSTTTEESFVSSLKRSSRGRLLKPVIHHLTGRFNAYSYNIKGEFQGLTSPVIDLTDDNYQDDQKQTFTPAKLKLKLESSDIEATEDEPVYKGIKPRGKRERSGVPGKRKIRVHRKNVLETDSESDNGKQSDNGRVTTRTTASRRTPPTSQERQEDCNTTDSDVPLTRQLSVPNKATTSAETSLSRNLRGNKGKNGGTSSKKAVVRQRRKRVSMPTVKKPSKNSFVSNSERKEKTSDEGRSSQSVEKHQKRGRGRPPKQAALTTKEKGVCRLSLRNKVSQEFNDSRDDIPELSMNKWTEESSAKLRRVVSSVPALSDDFWGIVSEKMGGMFSPSVCQRHYMEMGRSSRRNRKEEERTTCKKKNNEDHTSFRDVGVAITGRAGTMKRKRQLRNALEHLDQNYSDDMFESTPMQKRMRRVQTSFDDDLFTDEDEDSDHDEVVDLRSVTRNTDSTPYSYKERMRAPVSCTPQLNEYITPADLEIGQRRLTADSIVHRYQHSTHAHRPKRSTGPHLPGSRHSSKPQKVSKKQCAGRKDEFLQLRDIRTGEKRVFKIFEDSEDEEESDESMSDIEQDCHRILGSLH